MVLTIILRRSASRVISHLNVSQTHMFSGSLVSSVRGFSSSPLISKDNVSSSSSVPTVDEKLVKDIVSDEKLLKIFVSQLQLVLDQKNKDNDSLPNAKDESLCNGTVKESIAAEDSLKKDEDSEDDDESDRSSEDKDYSCFESNLFSEDDSRDDNHSSSDESKDESPDDYKLVEPPPIDNALPAQSDNKSSLEGDSSESLPIEKMENPLSREIEQEISNAVKCYNETVIRNDFPFFICDKPGTKSIFLIGKGEGEGLEVTIDCPDTYNCANWNREKNDLTFSMNLTVLVICVKTGTCRFEFKCTARNNRVTIDEVNVPEDEIDDKGIHFTELHENLKNEFHKYLEARGITPENTNFLYHYMLDKANREKLRLLKKIKEMVV